MNKYIVTLIGFDYDNKTDNFEVINDALINSFVVFETEKWEKERIKDAIKEFISDVYDRLDEGVDKEQVIADAYDRCRLPFATELYRIAMDYEGLTFRVNDYDCFGGIDFE